MKKIIFLLLLSIFLVSCSSTAVDTSTPTKATRLPSYVAIAADYYRIFDNEIVNHDTLAAIEELPDPVESKIQLGKQTIIADLAEIGLDREGNTIINCYESKDKKIGYQLNDKFYRIYGNYGYILLQNNEKTVSERILLKLADQYVSKFMLSNDYKSYQYSFYTAIKSEKTNFEKKDGFYICNSETEEVIQYWIEYRKLNCNGLITGDSVEIVFDCDGNIIRFSNHFNNNVDWDSVKYDTAKVKESIDGFFESYLKPGVSIFKYTVEDMQLSYIQNEIVLLVKLTVVFRDPSFGTSAVELYVF